jgi:citrate synthase
LAAILAQQDEINRSQEMSQADLEKRVTVLEEQVRQLMTSERKQPGPLDWLSTVGMFSGDEYMKQIDKAALAYRERDRRKVRRKVSVRRRRTRS